MQIILHSNDLTLIDYWQHSLNRACEAVDCIEGLKNLVDSVVIINRTACTNSCRETVIGLTEKGNHLLVLDRVPDFAMAKQLLEWGVKGYGNALMRDHFLVAAVETLQEGMVWLYPEFTTQLITQLDGGPRNDHALHLDKLSKREREVALLLKEGDLYKTVAEKLEITPRTVKAHAQKIYTKLSVKDRLGLALLLK